MADTALPYYTNATHHTTAAAAAPAFESSLDFTTRGSMNWAGLNPKVRFDGARNLPVAVKLPLDVWIYLHDNITSLQTQVSAAVNKDIFEALQQQQFGAPPEVSHLSVYRSPQEFRSPEDRILVQKITMCELAAACDSCHLSYIRVVASIFVHRADLLQVAHLAVEFMDKYHCY